MSAQWEIRVGGEYFLTEVEKTSFRRVTAIGGDMVHYDHVYRDGCPLSTNNKLSAAAFRSASCPEDASPIPALVAALKELRDAVMREGIERTEDTTESRSGELFLSLCVSLRKANEALALAEARA